MDQIEDMKKKNEIESKAHNVILLSFSDEVLREIEDEDQAIILLRSLPKMYEHFIGTILYGKDTFTMIEVKQLSIQNKFKRREKIEMRAMTRNKKNGEENIADGHGYVDVLVASSFDSGGEWALETFINWRKLLENQVRNKLKVLITDNGLEYCSNEFKVFYAREGIMRHKTVVKNPRQNEVAERMNMTPMERVRCLLLRAGLERPFWGEALMTSCYLINRCSLVANNFKTPQEIWIGKPPKFEHLRVFGCTTYEEEMAMEVKVTPVNVQTVQLDNMHIEVD
ncbi:uncharacterized protein LOC133038107 [Cannabis sativa]|uniref:uncharacterized protein LOC133038107 n=1 Tax=Cannabis sativa TaxID=3483 RepID=UPI0029CAA4B4|nr:uncharacterized protein LOC133038107 [Cannabis sativa]